MLFGVRADRETNVAPSHGNLNTNFYGHILYFHFHIILLNVQREMGKLRHRNTITFCKAVVATQGQKYDFLTPLCFPPPYSEI